MQGKGVNLNGNKEKLIVLLCVTQLGFITIIIIIDFTNNRATKRQFL